MKRIKSGKVKQEKPETSKQNEKQERDLAYYIHDRVELMHQVFSLIKPKDLKAMAPECVRRVSIDELKELCTDELLGISSKRLCAILDGAEPPTDTESSSSESPEPMETISLDSISSDEEILSQSSSKKSKKHKHRKHAKKKDKEKSKDKDKKQTKQKDNDNDKDTTSAKATQESRAGLTVLELLELQARARAIRAQLNKEKHLNPPTVQHSTASSSDSEIEIKEEPALVVEISSEDEKPAPEELKRYLESIPPSTSNCTVTRPTQQSNTQHDTTNVTKHTNDLVITVPQSKSNRKIKLNRNRSRISETSIEKDKMDTAVKTNNEQSKNYNNKTEIANAQPANKTTNNKKDSKKNKKKKAKKKNKKINQTDQKDGSDHDEITLQLSDTEKMDLLEDLEEKHEVSSTSEDSESSSDDNSDDSSEKETLKSKDAKKTMKSPDLKLIEKEPIMKPSEPIVTETVSEDSKDNVISELIEETQSEVSKNTSRSENNKSDTNTESVENIANESQNETNIQTNKENPEVEVKPQVMPKEEIERSAVEEIGSSIESQLSISASADDKNVSEVEPMDIDEVTNEKPLIISSINDIPIKETKEQEKSICKDNKQELIDIIASKNDVEIVSAHKETLQVVISGNKRSVLNKHVDITDNKSKNRSDGEISDEASSGVEAVELQPEVVCISDDDKEEPSKKKKKKKEKKAKKEKKSKKSKLDFQVDTDHNFYSEKVIPKIDNCEDNNVKNEVNEDEVKESEKSSPKVLDEDCDVYEILELSDDSSCYEVEGVSILSKEPTAEEIEAFSAKIDEIEREDVVTDKQMQEHEKALAEKDEFNIEDIENITWKDRYLASNKVKRVLTTSSIFNAIRRKNKELKNKISMAKKEAAEVTESVEPEKPVENPPVLEEGSIEHYNTLTGSTRYVNPVQENIEISENNTEEQQNKQVTNEMKKDAKQLMKMYKRLLKYNDINKQKDPNKRKKKKSKKSKDKSKVETANSVAT